MSYSAYATWAKRLGDDRLAELVVEHTNNMNYATSDRAYYAWKRMYEITSAEMRTRIDNAAAVIALNEK